MTYFFILCSSITLTLYWIKELLTSDKATSISFNVTDILVLSYFLYGLLRIAIAPDTPNPRISLSEQSFLLTTYLLGRRLIHERKNTLQFISISIVSVAAYQSILGVMQYVGYSHSYHSMYPVTGTFANPAPYAGFLATSLPFAMALLFDAQPSSPQNRIFKFIAWVSITASIVVLPATMSRAAWLATMAGVLIITLYQNRERIKKFKRFTIPTVATAIVVSIALVYFLYTLRPGSANGRLLTWKVTCTMIGENPLVGVGINQYASHYGKYQIQYFRQAPRAEVEVNAAGHGEYPFNEFLGTAAERGLVGLGLLLAILWSVLVVSFRKIANSFNDVPIAAYASIVSWITFSLFSYPFSSTPLVVLLIISLVILSSVKEPNVLTFNLKASKWMIGCIAMVCFLATAWMFSDLFQTSRTHKQWGMMTRLRELGGYKQAETIGDSLLSSLRTSGSFLFEYGQACALSGNIEKAIPVLERASTLTSDPYLLTTLGDCYKKTGRISDAERSYENAHYLAPYKFYPLYLLAKLYEESGNYIKAQHYAELIFDKKVKVPSQAIDEMKQHMKSMKHRLDSLRD